MPSLQDYTTQSPTDADMAAVTPDNGVRALRERELCVRMERMVDESRKQQESRVGKHKDALRCWRGDHYRNKKGRKKHGRQESESVVNKVFPIVGQQIALMTQNNPRAIFLPESNDDAQFTKDLEELTDWRAKRIKMRSHLIRSLYNCKIFGEHATYVYWDDSLHGSPDANVRLLHPNELVIDPHLQTCMPEDGNYVGFNREVDIEYVKWRWPESAERIQQGADQGTEDQYVIKDGATLDEELGHVNDRQSVANTEDGVDTDINEVTLTSMWYKDYTQQTYEIATPLPILKDTGRVVENIANELVYSDTGEKYFPDNAPRTQVDRPVYPNGRFTVKCQNVILVDEPWDEGLYWPIALGINSVIPMRWYGMDETEQLQGPQDVINDITNLIEDHVRATTNSPIAYEVDAVINPKKISSTADAKIPMQGGRINGITRLPAGSAGNDVYRLYELTNADIENRSGMSGTSMGRALTKNASATEVASLERAGMGRIGLAASLLDEYIVRIYILLAQVIQTNYDDKKIVRILGDDGQDRSITITQQHKNVKFDVDVEAGSTLPYDKDSKRNQAVELNNILGGAYLPEVLAAYEVKNKEEILQRHQVWQLFMQYKDLLAMPEVQQQLNMMLSQMQQGAPQNGQPQQ